MTRVVRRMSQPARDGNARSVCVRRAPLVESGGRCSRVCCFAEGRSARGPTGPQRALRATATRGRCSSRRFPARDRDGTVAVAVRVWTRVRARPHSSSGSQSSGGSRRGGSVGETPPRTLPSMVFTYPHSPVQLSVEQSAGVSVLLCFCRVPSHPLTGQGPRSVVPYQSADIVPGFRVATGNIRSVGHFSIQESAREQRVRLGLAVRERSDRAQCDTRQPARGGCSAGSTGRAGAGRLSS